MAEVSIGGYHVNADLVVMGGSPQPNYKLLAQAGARVEYDAEQGPKGPAAANVRVI